MDFNHSEFCFVCNKDVQDRGMLLSSETTIYSKTGFLTKLMQLLGDSFMVVILENDKICLRCVTLLNLTDKLELELSEAKNTIMGFLNEKYNLNQEEELLSTAVGIKDPQDSTGGACDETDVLDSPISSVNCTNGESYKPYDTEELFESHLISEIEIKSEPLLNSDQYLDLSSLHDSQRFDKLSEASSKPLLKDTFIGSQSGKSIMSQKSQDDLTSQENCSTDKIVNNMHNGHTAPIKGPSEKSDLKSCDNSNSGESIPEILPINELLQSKESGSESLNHADYRPLDENNRKSFPSKSNKQSKRKCEEVETSSNTVKKLRPILPKGSNIREVFPSLYLIQNADSSFLVNDEILNNHINYMSTKSESSGAGKNINKTESSIISNQCNSDEAEKLNSRTEVQSTSAFNILNRICSADFTESEDLESEENSQGRYKCRFCPKSFKRKFSIKNHEVLHTGEYSFFCEFCGQGFATTSKLHQHRKSHTKEKSYMCDVCGKKFHYHGTYWIHRKWHDNPFPYKCNDCGKLFKHSSLLSVHRRKHTGERPYKCSYCPLTFNVPTTLKRHVMLHTKQFPFRCATCDKGFTSRNKYSDHLAKKHGTILEKHYTDPKDYKMVIYEDEKKTEEKSPNIEETVEYVETDCNIEISEHPDIIFHNANDCQIEIILPQSSVISDNGLSSIDWLT